MTEEIVLRRTSLAMIKELKPGQSRKFAAPDYGAVRVAQTQCYQAGRFLNCKFSCSDNKDGTVTIKRHRKDESK